MPIRISKSYFNILSNVWNIPLRKQCSVLGYYQFNKSNYSTTTYGKNKIRIGCASGFWGDTWTAVPQLVKHGKLDFLVLDYLSEVTMSLLVAAKTKNPELGWCPDFALNVGPFLPQIKQQGIKVVANAGGVNPQACMKALLAAAEKTKTSIRVALVTGDDVLSSKDSLTKDQCPNPSAITSANAYLGAGPICRALELADIVITGRCTDSALALGPLMYSFNWSPEDFDKMATGSLAGHLIECGAQSTGGIFTDWEEVPAWEYIGFPIVECSSDGEIFLTKPENTGGLINRGTVSEQLMYEIDNPSAYVLPDVICNFSNVNLREEENGVWVSGASGIPPTAYYKIGGTYLDGYKSRMACPLVGPKAKEKARKTAEALLRRSRGIFQHVGLKDFTKVYIQILGTEEAYGNQARKENLDCRDVVLWVGVQHPEKKALEIFARELASAGTGAAPGLCTVIGGRPKPEPLLRFFSYLIPKDEIQIRIQTSEGHDEIYQENPIPTSSLPLLLKDDLKEVIKTDSRTGDYSYHLSELAWLRSGDKGDDCNIGVIARTPEIYPILCHHLTSDKIAKYFEHKFEHSENPPICQRYYAPGIFGLNFVLKNSLGGGGIASLNADPQGKGYAQMLADLQIMNVPKLI